MDGSQGQLKNTLQFRLSLWLSLVILGVALTAGFFSFLVAFEEANELQDDALRQTAALFDGNHLPVPQFDDQNQLASDDAEERVMVQLIPSEQERSHRVPEAGLAYPDQLPEGIQTLTLTGVAYRVFVKTMDGGKRIAIAQQTAVRNEIAFNGALGSLIPFLFLIPILLWVVADLVRKIFLPVSIVAVEVEQRCEQDLHPISQRSLPGEIRPFVMAINRLLARAKESMDMQRRFVADAAHELRSPLTALSLQAERLSNTEMTSIAGDRLAELRRGIERNRLLLDQLLMLARAQSPFQAPTTAISIQQVFRLVLADLIPLAEIKKLDIGVYTDLDCQVLISEMDLVTVVKNLVSNAIRHTPVGGRVDLSITLETDRILLDVEDTGPGIPEVDRDRVFHPFHRLKPGDMNGSGLGLSIVKSIVERYGGKVFLKDSTRSLTGLCVTLMLPRKNRNTDL